jgi:hypothetical protein
MLMAVVPIQAFEHEAIHALRTHVLDDRNSPRHTHPENLGRRGQSFLEKKRNAGLLLRDHPLGGKDIPLDLEQVGSHLSQRLGLRQIELGKLVSI